MCCSSHIYGHAPIKSIHIGLRQSHKKTSRSSKIKMQKIFICFTRLFMYYYLSTVCNQSFDMPETYVLCVEIKLQMDYDTLRLAHEFRILIDFLSTLSASRSWITRRALKTGKRSKANERQISRRMSYRLFYQELKIAARQHIWISDKSRHLCVWRMSHS